MYENSTEYEMREPQDDLDWEDEEVEPLVEEELVDDEDDM